MPAARVESAQAFLKLLSFHGLPVELVSMIGEVVGVASITALRHVELSEARLPMSYGFLQRELRRALVGAFCFL